MALLEKEWFIQAPWGRLSIVAWGDCCDPPVLLCHGVKDSAASFRPLVRLLPRKYYYIGVELPGNGRSDPMPPGLMISLYDLLYTIQVVVKHFRWETFTYIGHCVGCSLGYLYSVSYPGKVSKLILLDPITLGEVVPVERFSEWYKTSFTDYFDNYARFNSRIEDKPFITREEAIAKLVKRRGFTTALAEEALSRVTQPAGNGRVRFTFDKRLDLITYPPFSPEHIRRIFTNIAIPILTVVAEGSEKKGKFKEVPFLFDDKAFPNDNHRVRVVAGHHDVHIVHPERVASFVAQFLLHGTKGLDNKARL